MAKKKNQAPKEEELKDTEEGVEEEEEMDEETDVEEETEETEEDDKPVKGNVKVLWQDQFGNKHERLFEGADSKWAKTFAAKKNINGKIVKA